MFRLCIWGEWKWKIHHAPTDTHYSSPPLCPISLISMPYNKEGVMSCRLTWKANPCKNKFTWVIELKQKHYQNKKCQSASCAKFLTLDLMMKTVFCLTSASWSAVNIHGWEVKTFPQAFVFHSPERKHTAEPAWKCERLRLFPNASADPHTKEKVEPVWES